MGKQLIRRDSDVGMKQNRPGCMFGIFQILDYHHWHLLKKILPLKRNAAGRHGDDENPREKLIQDCRDDEAEELVEVQVQQSTQKAKHANKRSLKKEGQIRLRRVFGLTGRSRLWRTVSIHHLEPSDPRLPDLPVLEPSEEVGNAVDYLRHTLVDAKKHGVFDKKNEKARKAFSDQLNKDVRGHQLKECADVLELFNINKDLFVKILQDPDFHGLQVPNSRIKLSKSGSFPTADLNRRRGFKPSKLQHKQSEIWSLPKREKLQVSAQGPMLGASKSCKDTSVADAASIGSALEQDTVSLMRDRKESNLLVHGSLSTDEIKAAETRRGEDRNKPANELATDDTSGHEHSRRTSFEDNSLDRYAKLFEEGFRRVGRWHHSKSLKATSESDFLSGKLDRRTFRRNFSLPEFDFHCAQPNDQVSSDDLSSGQPSRTSLDSIANITRRSIQNDRKPVECAALEEAVQVTEFQNDLVNVESNCQNEPSENADELNLGKSYEQENMLQGSDSRSSAGLPVGIMDLKKNSHTELAQSSPDSVLDNCFQSAITPAASAESTVSEGSRLKPRQIDFAEGVLIDTDDELSDIRVEIDQKSFNHVEAKKDEAEFNYVRDVLELSGFTGKEYLEEWHLLDQPLSPAVFEEMEACLPDGTEFSGEEVGRSCDHQLLFDLVNQVLLEMYQRSFTYCPRALSYGCRVHPMPAGRHVVAAVWANIRGRLSSGTEKEQTLNDVVAGDMAKDDGWMNLQAESECLALDVEDMIFQELLDEMLSR